VVAKTIAAASIVANFLITGSFLVRVREGT
jgi:hypothetical protein